MRWMAPASGIEMCPVGCCEDSQQEAPSIDNVTTLGIDLAKSVFQLHGVDARGKVLLRRQLRRSQMLEFFQRLPPCLIGIEACASAHYRARELTKSGHEVRLMVRRGRGPSGAAQARRTSYVKGYVKRGQTDAADAEARLVKRYRARRCGLFP